MIAAVADCFSAKNLPIVFSINVALFCGRPTWQLCWGLLWFVALQLGSSVGVCCGLWPSNLAALLGFAVVCGPPTWQLCWGLLWFVAVQLGSCDGVCCGLWLSNLAAVMGFAVVCGRPTWQL